MDTLKFIIFMSLFNASLLIFFIKIGLVALYQLHAPRWLPRDCNYCCFFWFAVLYITSLNVAHNWQFCGFMATVYYAFISAPLSLFIFNTYRQ